MVLLLESGFGASDKRSHRCGIDVERLRDCAVAQSRVAQEQERALLRLELAKRVAHCFLFDASKQAVSRVLAALTPGAKGRILNEDALLALAATAIAAQGVQRGVTRGPPQPAFR